MDLFCVGVSHHTANVEARERYAAKLQVDAALAETTDCCDAFVLTTCNRVEVYGAAADPVATDKIARRLLADATHLPDSETGALYHHAGEKCVQHLFRVVCGLDSMVVGETEILGQAKKAYANARISGDAGSCLHRLFQRAFRVAKQVRTRTGITRGAVSVGSVAVDLAVKIFGALDDRKVLVLGAGETSERTARALVSRGVRDLRVSNRSLPRAENVASLVGGRAVPFECWREQCREIDILISSTSAEEVLLTPETLAPMISTRLDRPLFIIDIAVPRNVAAGVNDLDGVYLYDIDSLQSIAERSLALRREQMAVGEQIIAEHVKDFGAWLRGRLPGGRTAHDKMAPHAISPEAPLRTSES